MIRLWLARDNSIPIREQLSAQLLLGILSRGIAPGERLPSVRELARRLKVHANTVSAAYQDLASRGWVNHRKGSGVFVGSAMPVPAADLDSFARAVIEEARAHGFAPGELLAALSRCGEPQPERTYVVVHPDVELAAILAAEIEEASGKAVSFAAPGGALVTLDCCLLVTATTAASILASHKGHSHEVIRLKPMEEVIAGQRRGERPPLVAIVSRSATVRQWSGTLISSLGFNASEVLLRNPAEPGWTGGLAACDIVAADVIAARELPRRVKASIIRIVDSAFASRLVTAEKV